MATASTTTLAELLTKLYEMPFIDAMNRGEHIYKWLPKRSMDGDTEHLKKIHYAGNISAGSYAELDTLGQAGVQAYIRAAWGVKLQKVIIQVSGLMEAASKGSGGYFRAMASETTEGLADLRDVINTQLLQTSKVLATDLDGLPEIINNSGSYATINSGVYLWWAAYVNTAADRPLTMALMQDVYRTLRDRPRLAKVSDIFTGYVLFDAYGNLLTGLRRFTAEGQLVGGFEDDGLSFYGRTVKPIPNYPIKRMDFLDDRYWRYMTLQGFKATSMDPGNVDAERIYYKHYGMDVCEHRGRQGSLQNIIPGP
jgi:hypothetical protein